MLRDLATLREAFYPNRLLSDSVRGSFAVGLLVVTLLAGCLQEDAPVTDPSGNLVEKDLFQGMQRDLPVQSFEPTLGVTSDGTLFMSTWNWDDRIAPIMVMRSTDQGQTWEDVTPRVGPVTVIPNTNDPFVYVDEDTDRVFTFDLQGTVCQTLSWSDDLGETWLTNPAACGLPPGAHDHQNFFTSWSRTLPTVGYEKVLHYCVNRLVDAACSASFDAGLTWGPMMRITPPPTSLVTDGYSCGGLLGHGVGAPDGRIYVGYGCLPPQVARSDDDGLTWIVHTIADHEVSSHDVGIAVDASGMLHALWITEDGPFYSRSMDHAETWSEPVMVAPEGVNMTTLPAIAAGDEGRAVMTYYGTTANRSDYDWQYSFGPEVTWNAYATIVYDDMNGTNFITTTFNDPQDPIGRGVCGAVRCRNLPLVQDPPPPSPGDFLDVVINPDGRPWAALVDTCRDTCATDGDPEYSPALGAVGTLRTGPSLRGPLVPLAPLAEE